MENESSKHTPIKDAAGLALTAYIGVKAFQAVSATTVSAVSFVRARKYNKKHAMA